MCILKVPPKHRKAVLDGMYHEAGIAGSTAGGLRLCPHIYNTEEHLERAIHGVRAMRDLIIRDDTAQCFNRRHFETSSCEV